MTFQAMMDSLTDDQRAWLFERNPPEALEQSLRSRGLDVDCKDADTLAAVAKIHVGYVREREAAQTLSGR